MPEFWYALFPIGFGVALGAYALALKIRLFAVVDTVWASCLGVAAVIYYCLAAPGNLRGTVALLIMLFWSGRLTLHLVRDRILTGKEDPRYAALAKHWGDRARFRFLFVFLGQIPLVALFLLPFTLAVDHTTADWRLLDSLALLIALTALWGEMLADRQLARFRADPANAGGVCQEGLWRYSRHPNYFFEWLHWFAYVAFAWGAPLGWLALVGPVMMYLFLRYVTGVPFAERSSLRSRGEAYRKYQKTTNTFFPWRPQRDPN
jgi:steroid 5-alpha reductase family enzyme